MAELSVLVEEWEEVVVVNYQYLYHRTLIQPPPLEDQSILGSSTMKHGRVDYEFFFRIYNGIQTFHN
ncbi:cell division control protein 2-like protein [Cucumis melo var. makuwa]|uniref:Cell division control protein 2-like protein n=1 Tax=Cucumis melo var. makuwa TaxID=1194695 RepID=A0A5A7V155_CUCMM|nr:cell division control protein 2-like protein [Cucumis melo var. makuwa]TYK14804.1 cell division control protein 2-like protein [Cucumis melo var. makuwa]